ncbi:type I-C CRISPR-associated protein Cas8c/Csd1 [Azospirillum doebereinerae]|uniref:Type I-C CRISPR-associated protein Cas8c/Csd1 n=2 Tax=Azospirillum doebereinerae TaxID=92933 RepID=A0A433JG32_9PROT|nr:type I-C CRISPR-associated protein Cas8c/Csd1 [Azospirillum doebereinerae]
MLAALNGYYDRLADRGDVPPFGYSTERIAYFITLSPTGEPMKPEPWQSLSGKKPEPRPTAVPQSFKRPGITPRSFFLWDNTKFALGLGLDKTTKRRVAHPANWAAFQALHRRLLAGTEDAGLLALLGFLDAWSEERFEAAGFTDAMLDQNMVFMLDGDRNESGQPRFLHDRPAARRIWERQVADGAGSESLCLVTGTVQPVARLHPAIKGVMGAQSSGASIVSFNNDAFESYGKAQGLNAPVSEAAAFGYGTALNAMLARGSGNRLQVGDATVVFWADTSGGEAAAQAAETLFADLLDPPRPDEAGEAQKIKDTLRPLGEGRPLREIDPKLDERTRFFILGLSPNIARLSVRFWLEDSFGAVAEHIGQHWRDLEIKPDPWRTAPSAWALSCETALQRKSDNVAPLLAGELMRAILTGGRYPRSLLAAVITRIRAGDEITGAKAALCKACLTRDSRLGSKKEEELPVSLNRDEANAGYRLGRLFAVLENTQRAALGKVNASIRDRYFGAASATPASVFPMLLRNSTHHLAVLRKGDKARLGGWLEGEMAQILGGIGTLFPRSLRIEDQGRFAIGYYHQRYAGKADAPAPSGLPSDAPAAAPAAATTDSED